MIKKTTVNVKGREFDIVNKDQHPQSVFTPEINILGNVFNDFPGTRLPLVPEERLPTWIINKLK